MERVTLVLGFSLGPMGRSLCARIASLSFLEMACHSAANLALLYKLTERAQKPSELVRGALKQGNNYEISITDLCPSVWGSYWLR